MSSDGEGRQATPRRPGGGPFVPFESFEDIVAKCGHVEKFGLLPEGKDRFREDRRRKAAGRDCKACREQKQLREREAARLRRAQKEQGRAKGAGRAEVKHAPQSGRLPDGSRFEVSYDAAKQQWSGSLTVPTPGGASATFTGSGSGLFPLLAALDKQYRATLA